MKIPKLLSLHLATIPADGRRADKRSILQHHL